jgi:hypothetical protein
MIRKAIILRLGKGRCGRGVTRGDEIGFATHNRLHSTGADHAVISRRQPEVDFLGPVFVSYRDSDGAERANCLAWTLRSTGLPVYRDKDDLPPGETRSRLREGLGGGLSAGLVVVTPDITNSEIVRHLELPKLLRLGRNPDFLFVIANTIPNRSATGKESSPDYAAPDKVLRSWWQLPKLRSYHQHRYFSDDDAGMIAKAVAIHRMRRIRESGAQELEIDMQTRGGQPGAWRRPAPLVVRTPPPQDARHRTPQPEAWRRFAPFLDNLPSLVDEAGAQTVRLKGGGHLAAATALGAALPTTSGRKLLVVDHDDAVWQDAPGAAIDVAVSRTVHSGAGRIAVLLDCAIGPGYATFSNHVNGESANLAASLVLSTQGRRIDPAHAGRIADDLAQLIRDEAVATQSVAVDLCMRMPFPLAVMVGRRLNTLELRLYEWETDGDQPRYIPVLTVASGRGRLVVDIPGDKGIQGGQVTNADVG